MDTNDQKVKNAGTIANIIKTLHKLQEAKGKYVGSGFIMDLSNLAGVAFTTHFLSGETYDMILSYLIQDLEYQLRLRKSLIQKDLETIDNYLTPSPKID